MLWHNISRFRPRLGPPRAPRLRDGDRDGPWSFLAANVAVVSPYAPAPDGVVQYSEQLISGLEGKRTLRRIPIQGGPPDFRVYVRGGPRVLRLLRATDVTEQVLIMWHPHYFFYPRYANRLITYLALALFFRCRDVVVLVHEPHRRVGAGSLGERMRSRVEECARWVCWSSPMTVAVHTEYEAQAFVRRYPTCFSRPVHTVEHGAFFRSFASVTRQEAREHLSLPPDRHIFLSLGFISPHKDVARAVRAFAAAATGGAVFYCVGSPIRQSESVKRTLNELRELAAEIDGFTLIEEFVDDAAFDTWILAADTVVATYRTASSSGMIERARMLKTPVISTAPGGIAEQLGEADVLVMSDADLRAALRERASSGREQDTADGTV
jgi:glycosyltransferase involved in cell wall biosynthesis